MKVRESFFRLLRGVGVICDLDYNISFLSSLLQNAFLDPECPIIVHIALENLQRAPIAPARFREKTPKYKREKREDKKRKRRNRKGAWKGTCCCGLDAPGRLTRKKLDGSCTCPI